ncbi:MAG TPA: ATP-binding cassette domain-containing protein [Thermoanaerobaculia bacterium]
MRIRNISKRYGSLKANDDVSLDIRRGSVHALLGENGAGKSTLMHILAGLVPPDTGTVWIGSDRLSRYEPREAKRLGIAIMRQQLTLIPALTGLENIALLDSDARLDHRKGSYLRRVGHDLERYEIRLDLTKPVYALSQAEKQLLDFFRALYLKSSLLILDEPTAVVGPVEGDGLLRRARAAADEGRTVLLVTHKIRELMAFADTVSVLRKGRLITSLAPADTSSADLVRAMVGATPQPLMARQSSAQRAPLVDVDIHERKVPGHEPPLREVKFTINAGEVLGVAGMAGNGQDRLASIVARRPNAAAAAVRVQGASGESDTVAYIPADRHALASSARLSIKDNLTLRCFRTRPFSRFGFLDSPRLDGFARQCCENFQIGTTGIDAELRTLSGGNVQRVILARELASRPRVIVAHNPTAGLDVAAALYVHIVLEQSVAGNAAVLLISDDLDELLLLSDRILVLHSGASMGVYPRTNLTRESVGRLMTGLPLAHAEEDPCNA